MASTPTGITLSPRSHERASERARALLSRSDALTPDEFGELDDLLREVSFVEFTALTSNPAYQAQLRAYEALARSTGRWVPVAASAVGIAILVCLSTLLLG
ncbi:hypothetical protein GRI97_07155 [Altererythrobacter xixiisoli]|uniref:Uncharacterized protein n=1 Tax=Croceibacterium xixiisoli TaxID=1476466 RepID=A0A6I4TU82_9SPHN|nr:hypothetical protein [Croceibacterium xixiisoli]MXO98760.1 hypothetical protein [Croceibacterium xixiisoli]